MKRNSRKYQYFFEKRTIRGYIVKEIYKTGDMRARKGTILSLMYHFYTEEMYVHHLVYFS